MELKKELISLTLYAEIIFAPTFACTFTDTTCEIYSGTSTYSLGVLWALVPHLQGLN